MGDIDDEWEAFLDDDNTEVENTESPHEIKKDQLITQSAPEPTDIYISTRTEIAFLNTEIDLKKYFWLIPVNNYDDMKEGVIKKQMKFISNNEEEFDTLGGIMLQNFSTFPKLNDSIVIDDLRFVIFALEEKRISSIKVTRTPN